MRTLQASIVAAWLAVPAALQAQGPPRDTLDVLLESHRVLQRFGRDRRPDVWPGYRPDTIPFLYVIPGRGTLLLNWPDTLPSGFSPVPDVPRAGWRAGSDRSAASTGVQFAGHATAQVVIQSLAPDDLVGVSAHEAFHVFERSAQREGSRFGRTENSFYVSQYPVFDVANEADVALEGKLLAAALAARLDAEARRLARQFTAVREARQRRMGPNVAEFEAMSEINEGLAQYALVRATSPDSEIARLSSITADVGLSVRLRFYTSGAALALLLDRLAGPAWKTRLMTENVTMQAVLAVVSGYRAEESSLRAGAARSFDAADLARRAAAAVTALRARRRRMADSLLARPGVLVEIVGEVGQYGFDPQNILPADSGVVLHMRWLHICGGGLDGEFNAPVVEDAGRGTLSAVIGAEGEVRVTVRGAPIALADLGRLAGVEEVRIESPGLTLRVSRADLERDGTPLRLRVTIQR
jgi:hypothetical protein